MEEHCPMHSGNTTMLNNHSDQISDLYDKHEETRKLLADIKTCIGVNAVKMDNGFSNAVKALEGLQAEIKSMNTVREKTLEYYDKVVEDIQKNLAELNKFKWFRDWMNGVRNNLPKWVLWLVLAALGALIAIHQLDLMRFFRKG